MRSIRTWRTLASVAARVAFDACHTAVEKTDDSELRFLAFCEGECGGDLSCVCGVCAQTCGANDVCDNLADGATSVPQLAKCGEFSMESRATCEFSCDSDESRASLGDGYRCVRGACRRGSSSVIDGGGGALGKDAGGGNTGEDASADSSGDGGNSSDAGNSGDAGEPSCPRYSYAPALGCREFTWGGCEPNGNNFETLEACQTACLTDPCAYGVPFSDSPPDDCDVAARSICFSSTTSACACECAANGAPLDNCSVTDDTPAIASCTP